MNKYSELAERLEASCFDKDNFPRMGTERAATANLCADAAAALRELEAENDKLNALRLLPLHSEIKVLRARVAELEAENRMYSESLANATQEIEGLRTERDRLREDLALAIHTISHQLDNIPKEMRRIAADRIAQFRETLARAALEGKG